MRLIDSFQRPLHSLRLSVTDRCNHRCGYCMPENDYQWIPRDELLTFEEFTRLVEIFAKLGVHKLRLTGGEPLLRRDIELLIAQLARVNGIDDLALTTNGVLLAEQATALAAAGLRRVTISLDTLQADRFRNLTSRDDLARVLSGINAVQERGFQRTKLNSVIIRGVNDDELVALIEFGKAHAAEVRFLEYMDVGGATRWRHDAVVSRAEMLARLTAYYGEIQHLRGDGRAPAEQFELADGTRFGIIASTTAPFCSGCDRSRLTADGHWYLCLYARSGIDLRAAVRGGATTEEIAATVRDAWTVRADRGAETRLQVPHRGPWVPLSDLRSDYHLEMHKRGG